MAEEGRSGQAAMCDVDSKMARLSVQDAELSPHCWGLADFRQHLLVAHSSIVTRLIALP